MTHPFFALLRIQARQSWRDTVARLTGNSGSVARWFVALLGAAGLLPLVAMFYAGYTVAFRFSRPGGAAITLLGAVLASAQLVAMLFGLFYLLSSFFYSKDRAILARLPLRPMLIGGTRFFWVVVGEYMSLAPFVLPAMVAFGLQVPVGPGYWLRAVWVYLWLPVAPLALDGVVLLVLSRLTNLSRSREVLRLVGALVALLVVAGLQLLARATASRSFFGSAGRGLTSPDGPVAAVARHNPVARLGAAGLAPAPDWGALAGYTLVGLGALALVLLLAERYLLPASLAADEVVRRPRRSGARLDWRQRTPLGALVWREVNLLIRTPVYLLNVLMALLLPAFFLIPVVLARNEMAALFEWVQGVGGPWVPLIGTGLALMASASTALAATAVSREGRKLALSQALPVPPRLHVQAKVAVGALAGLLGGLSAAIATAVLGAAPTWVLLVVPGSLLAGATAATAGLAVDLWRPYLTWQDPQQAMKGNFNSFLGLVAALAVALPAFGLAALAGALAGAGTSAPVAWVLLAGEGLAGYTLCNFLAAQVYGGARE